MVALELKLQKGATPPLPRIAVEIIPEVEPTRFYVLSADIDKETENSKESSLASRSTIASVCVSKASRTPTQLRCLRSRLLVPRDHLLKLMAQCHSPCVSALLPTQVFSKTLSAEG